MEHLISLIVLLLTCTVWASGSEMDSYEERRELEQAAFFERDAAGSSDMYEGFALLFLGQDLETGNTKIRAAYDRMLAESAEEMGVETPTEMTPLIAEAERLKWQMRTWVRIYYLFSDQSEEYPGRLSAENQVLIEDLFWSFLNAGKNQI